MNEYKNELIEVLGNRPHMLLRQGSKKGIQLPEQIKDLSTLEAKKIVSILSRKKCGSFYNQDNLYCNIVKL